MIRGRLDTRSRSTAFASTFTEPILPTRASRSVLTRGQTAPSFLPLSQINRLLADAGRNERVVVFRPGGKDGHALEDSTKAIDVLERKNLSDPLDVPET